MAAIRGFKALRPDQSLAKIVSELPYDVVNRAEVEKIVGDNKKSFYRVTRSEVDFPEGADPYGDAVYEQARKNLETLIAEGSMKQDPVPSLYLYTLIMNGRSQTGLVSCVSIDDYKKGTIKKHEFTREDKENDRTRHLDILNANTGPVFLLYNNDSAKRALMKRGIEIEPEIDFTSEDNVRHIVRVIQDTEFIGKITAAFRDDPLYIADGHHRAASAVRVGEGRRKKEPDYSGDEEFNWFLSVIFPDDELAILPYNRVVHDLNGLTPEAFLGKIKENFSVEENGPKEPPERHSVSLYLDREWYLLTPDFPIADDPVESLDVQILQTRVLAPLLGIEDPRRDTRIDFIGGIRGTAELEQLVDGGKGKAAFSLFPVSVGELTAIADSNRVMPPKSTWFEPKLRSGLFVHLL